MPPTSRLCAARRRNTGPTGRSDAMAPDLFAAVEGPPLSAHLNVASGFPQFLRALESRPEVQALLKHLRTREDTVDLLLRVLDLVSAPSDPQYEHPHDVALAAYLWVLSVSDPSSAKVAAELV